MDKVKAMLALLDGKKTYLAGLLVSSVTYLWPPATDLVRNNPELAPAVISLLMAALRSVATKPGVVAQISKRL